MSLLIGPYRALLRQRINWLLRDDYDTPVAAGSVNGTLAVPGPGVRVVTDTGNNVSIVGGVLQSRGLAGAADPRVGYLRTFERVPGRMLFHRAMWNTNRGRWGFDDAANPGGAQLYFGIEENSGILTIAPPYSTTMQMFVTTFWYRTALVLGGGQEGFFFARGGGGTRVYPQWTLLWVANTGIVADPLYVFALAARAVDCNMDVDFVRIPDVLWTPQPLASDSFNRANGALGNTDGLAVEEQRSGAGLAWVNQIGTTLVNANVAQASALVGGLAIATVDCGSADVLHEAKLTRAGGNSGISLRYADSSNYVIGYHDGTNCRLDKVIGGVTTNVITAVVAYAAGAVLRVICEGTQFSLYYNNAQVGATSTINDAAVQTPPLVGVYSTNTGNTQDDMTTWARGTGGEYAYLGRFTQ